MLVNIAISGACGRMGQAIAKLILEDKELKLFSAIEAPRNPNIGKDYGEVLGVGKINVEVLPKMQTKVDVLIDFSTPPATMVHLTECAAKETAMVIGTTGLSEGQVDEVKKATRKIACLIASNMSLGMNILFKRVPELAKILGDDYDIEIVETHHRNKKDAPSGTAKTLAENIAKAQNKSLSANAVYGRYGDKLRKRGEIGIHAVRAGDNIGEHRIIFSTVGETIEILHKATSREIFASGALRAAKFIANAKPGFYTFADIIVSPQ